MSIGVPNGNRRCVHDPARTLDAVEACGVNDPPAAVLELTTR